MQSSTANLLVINLERYLSIAYPLLHKTSITNGKHNSLSDIYLEKYLFLERYS